MLAVRTGRSSSPLNMGGVPIGAFDDAAVADVLDLPADHEPLYLVPVGYPDR